MEFGPKPIAFETRVFRRTYRATGHDERDYVERFVRDRIMREVEEVTGQRIEVPIEWTEDATGLTARCEFKYLSREA